MAAQAQAARLSGYDPQAFVIARRAAMREEPFGTVHVVASPIPRAVGSMAPLHRPWLVPALVRFLRERRGPHVIHAHAGWTGLAVAAAAQLRRGGVDVRVVGEFYATLLHEYDSSSRTALVRSSARWRLRSGLIYEWVRCVGAPNERRGYERADLITVNYENVRRLLLDAYGDRRGIVRIAYCAPQAFGDEPRFAERTSRDDGAPPLIVAVSSQSARKGLDVLIAALVALRDRGIRFRAVLAGGGPLLGAHRRLVRSAGLEREVTLPGIVPDPLPYLRACDVFVLPSVAEQSGSVSVLEALQAGAPIVSTDVDGMPEDLTHEHDALLVPPREPRALGDAIARLLADGDLRRRLSRNARATYEARFAPERAASDLARVYEGLGLEAPVRPARIQ
jgi:glycosyltransferase involved in cell wall biosynthesis